MGGRGLIARGYSRPAWSDADDCGLLYDQLEAAETTKTDPESFSPLTEVAVSGTLRIAGTQQHPITFAVRDGKTPCWGGIVVDGGTAVVSSATISGATLSSIAASNTPTAPFTFTFPT